MVWDYATANNLKVCEGTASQCLLTPSILDHIGDAFAYCGKSRPWQTHIPGASSATVQIFSVPSIATWQLTLVSEQVLLKVITGHSNTIWKEAAYKAYQKAPSNIFYEYVWRVAAGKEIVSVGKKLLPIMEKWDKPGKQWYWNSNNIDTATGYDLILLATLVSKGW
jgi:hypothetical protein